MTRATVRLDRVAGLLAGLLLTAGGVAVVLWWARVLAPDSDRLSVAGASGWADQAWWPVAVGVVGLVLAVLALAWLTAHLRRVGIRAVSLPGSGDEGRLRLRLDSLADAVADSAESRLATDGASGSVGHGVDSGIVEVTVTARHDASLDELRRDLAAVDAEVAAAAGGAVPVRYRVEVARPPRTARTA